MSDERLPAEPSAPEPDLDPEQVDEPPIGQDIDEAYLEEDVEPEAEPEPEPQAQPEPRRGRANDTIRTLRSRAQEAERRAADLERRMSAFEARQTMPDPRVAQQAAAQEEQQFRESLVGLMPEEIALRVTERTERRMQAQLAAAEVRGFDRNDRIDFEKEAAVSRFAASKRQEVEDLLGRMRSQGVYQFGRLDILDLLDGRNRRLTREQTTQQQRRNGARNVARETVRPASGRGEGGGGGRRTSQEDADIALLKGARIGDVI